MPPLRRGLKNGKYNSAPRRHICRPLPVSHQPTKARRKRCPAPSGCFGQAVTPLPCITAHLLSREYRLGGAPAAKRGCHAWDSRISLPKDAPAAKGRCGRGTGLHWPEPQRLGTTGRRIAAGRLPGTPRAAALFRPPKKKKTGTALDEPPPLPSVQPARGIPGITAPPVQP